MNYDVLAALFVFQIKFNTVIDLAKYTRSEELDKKKRARTGICSWLAKPNLSC
jgi:hypothetical protein